MATLAQIITPSVKNNPVNTNPNRTLMMRERFVKFSVLLFNEKASYLKVGLSCHKQSDLLAGLPASGTRFKSDHSDDHPGCG